MCVEYLCSNSSQTSTLSSSNTSDRIQKRELYYLMRCKLQIRRVKHMGRVNWCFEVLPWTANIPNYCVAFFMVGKGGYRPGDHLFLGCLLARSLWSCLRLKYWFEGNSRNFKEIVKDHIGGFERKFNESKWLWD